jgi:SET domain-containing protein
VPQGQLLHEYLGEIVSQEEAERRGRLYDKHNQSYLFNVDSETVLDACPKGGKGKFANHLRKAMATAATKVMFVNGDHRVGLYATKDLAPETEIFFDYRYEEEMHNEHTVKTAVVTDWMKDAKMAARVGAGGGISIKNASSGDTAAAAPAVTKALAKPRKRKQAPASAIAVPNGGSSAAGGAAASTKRAKTGVAAAGGGKSA